MVNLAKSNSTQMPPSPLHILPKWHLMRTCDCLLPVQNNVHCWPTPTFPDLQDSFHTECPQMEGGAGWGRCWYCSTTERASGPLRTFKNGFHLSGVSGAPQHFSAFISVWRTPNKPSTIPGRHIPHCLFSGCGRREKLPQKLPNRQINKLFWNSETK